MSANIRLAAPLGSGGKCPEWSLVAAHSCPLRVLHVLTSPGGLHHFPLLLPDVGLQRALAIAAVPRVVDDRGVPGNTGYTQRMTLVGRGPRVPH